MSGECQVNVSVLLATCATSGGSSDGRDVTYSSNGDSADGEELRRQDNGGSNGSILALADRAIVPLVVLRPRLIQMQVV